MDELGLKGRAIAKTLGVREQTVSSWRKGLYRPEGARLVRLAEVLHVEPEALRSDDRKHSNHVAESSPTYGAESPARLAGRAFEIEALLAYALDRQRQLGAALSEAEHEEIRRSVRQSAGEQSQEKEA